MTPLQYLCWHAVKRVRWRRHLSIPLATCVASTSVHQFPLPTLVTCWPLFSTPLHPTRHHRVLKGMDFLLWSARRYSFQSLSPGFDFGTTRHVRQFSTNTETKKQETNDPLFSPTPVKKENLHNMLSWESICSALQAFIAAPTRVPAATQDAGDLLSGPVKLSAETIALRELVTLWIECYHTHLFKVDEGPLAQLSTERDALHVKEDEKIPTRDHYHQHQHHIEYCHHVNETAPSEGAPSSNNSSSSRKGRDSLLVSTPTTTVEDWLPSTLPHTAALLQGLCYAIQRMSMWLEQEGGLIASESSDGNPNSTLQSSASTTPTPTAGSSCVVVETGCGGSQRRGEGHEHNGEEEEEASEGVALAEVNRTLKEMSAMALLLSTRQLPAMVTAPSTWSTVENGSPPSFSLSSSSALIRRVAEEEEERENASTAVVTTSSVHEDADWVNLRAHRGTRERERLRSLALRAPQRVVQEAVVLVETVQAVLRTPALSASSHHLLAALYPPLLSVLGLSEQLDSATLAALATSIAQCAESYSIEEHLRLAAAAEAETEAAAESTSSPSALPAPREEERGEPVGALRAALRRWYSPSPTTPSEQAENEAAALRRYCPEGPPRFCTTTTLSHLHVLARVCQQRMEMALCEYTCTKLLRLREEEESEEEVWHDSAEKEMAAIKAYRAFEGKLALLSLTDRKRLLDPSLIPAGNNSLCLTAMSPSEEVFVSLSRQFNGPPSRRVKMEKAAGTKPRSRRKTMADFEREASASSSALPQPPASSDDEILKGIHTISLSDAAEVADALASMRYRETTFWSTLARFTRWQMYVAVSCCRRAPARAPLVPHEEKSDNPASPAPSTPNSTSTTSLNRTNEISEAELERCIDETRRICFALNFVQQEDEYRAVMAELVGLGVLPQALPPPSSLHAAAAMRHA